MHTGKAAWLGPESLPMVKKTHSGCFKKLWKEEQCSFLPTKCIQCPYLFVFSIFSNLVLSIPYMNTIALSQDLFGERNCWDYIGAGSLLFIEALPESRCLGSLFLMIFPFSLPWCSPNLWCSNYIISVQAETRKPTGNFSCVFTSCGFLYWSLLKNKVFWKRIKAKL